jgi:hypothetical protein
MANVKISALPSTTAATLNDWVIKNDSGETTTSKVELKYTLGLTSENGNDSIQSASWLSSLGTTGNTTGAVAIGAGAEATSPYSVAIGYQAYNVNRDGGRDGYISVGYQANAVQYSIALGYSPDALGSDTIAVGTNAGAYGNSGLSLGISSFQASTNGVAIGAQAEDYANQAGVAIGYDTYVSHDGAVSLGSGVTSVYSSTTHVDNFHINRTLVYKVTDAGIVGGSIDVDCSIGSVFLFELSANTTPNFINVKEGQTFTFIVYNNGTHTVSTATVGGVSSTVYSKGGSINPTNNGYTKYNALYADGIMWLNEELDFTAV